MHGVGERRRCQTCVFFFSSRRRHTRCSRDWSSDVCSSDLITLEANPESVTAEKLEDWKRVGINRLSIGLQAYDDALLKTMGRLHDCAAFARSEEHTSELQSRLHLVCRLLLEKKKPIQPQISGSRVVTYNFPSSPTPAAPHLTGYRRVLQCLQRIAL